VSQPREATPLRPLGTSILPLLLVPTAIAIAAILVWLRFHFQPPTVPAYALATHAAGAVLRPGDHFEADVRPASPVTGAVAARAFLLRGNEVRAWDPPFEVARDGSVRIAGRVAELFPNVPTGEWEMAVTVGRPETLPTTPRDVLRVRDAHSDAGAAAWRLVRQWITLGG
jgi:hypothetical protein